MTQPFREQGADIGDSALPAPCSPLPWPRHRWWLLVTLVFAMHVGLAFVFGERRTVVARPRKAAPVLRLATGQSELLALSDPTLFALPHPRSFASSAWLQNSRVEFPPFRWTDSPSPGSWPLAVEQLGSTFLHFAQTNQFARFEFATMPAPEMNLPEPKPEFLPGPKSVLRVEGDLANRRLLNPAELPSLPGADLLTNSAVQLLVDAAGNVVTLIVLGSGAKTADQVQADKRALELARAMRFAPLPPPGSASANPGARLTGGVLVFDWHTVPRLTTNAPAPSIP